jgi:hypothetical protein
MPYTSCRICQVQRYIKPYHLAKGWGKYCSNQCKFVGQKTGCNKACQQCYSPVYRSRKDQVGSTEGRFFCNRSCQAKWRNSRVLFGANHGNWKGGTGSYRTILKRTNRPQLCVKCQTTDYRILAVHHKDKDRTNNNPLNLLWLCHNCHYMVHHYPEEAHGYIVAKLTS